jgi:pimeloyl-ACP methyl ester carboxylesterase
MSEGFERIPLVIAYREPVGVRDTYGGIEGQVVLQAHHLKPAAPSDTLVIFMHPMGIMHYLPLPRAMAAAGVHCLSAVSRYPNNDSALIMEKVVLDLGAWVRHAREKLGYAKVVLGGWSGGGALALFYQSQAERPTITATPAGDPCDLTAADLIPADAVMLLAAHVSRAVTLTEWLDPSVVDENDPANRDPAWNLYADPPRQAPPYPADWVAEFRERQIARNRRITAWAEATLAELRRRDGPHAERAFVVHGTMADPRWLDPAIDPNDRQPGRCYLGDPRLINDSPGGLGRFTTTRSWLSQWSYDRSNAEADRCGGISVPVLVIGNSADDACTPSHTHRLFDAVRHDDKELHTVKGATHYYAYQPKELAEACAMVTGWLVRKALLPSHQRGERS